MIQILLTDSKISAKVLENFGNQEKYKICTIKENGNVVLGKTIFPWWNKLINCQDVLPFESFALKVWDALVDMSRDRNKQAIMKGLSQEIVMQSVREHEYDKVIRRLFTCWSYVAQDSEGYQRPEYSEEYTTNNLAGKQVVIAKKESPKIVINVDGMTKTIPIIDSVGDAFDISLDFGLKGVRKI